MENIMAKDLFKGSEIVCKALIKEGVNVVFGIPGGAILPLYGTLNNFPEIKHILCLLYTSPSPRD